MPLHHLVNYISGITNVSETDELVLEKAFHCMEVPRGTIVESDGRVVEKMYFLVDGVMRMSCNHDGLEVTTQLVHGNSLVTVFESFVNQEVSTETLSAVTDCHLMWADKASYDILMKETVSWKYVCKYSYERFLAESRQRSLDLLTLTAEERYQKLYAKRPELYQHVPLKYIASYLGIRPETLSRIRSAKTK
ncbi:MULTISPECIES: Crp/Fnr family transcriptional regulator [unclassified Flavobacterium]|uniref:Crp/Fnr family transcriptional regulator n=1 Tax=unclassified Flavobacterium TaxID=196869 RepID=UPI001F133DC0|nr:MULTISPECIES: Crp/Fnr family transcriptional regulator [unclassified Flavobacterium]UMY65641.1 Crp/Fnr family transcriptional regulator [Flavobacterium sp. HJ-32-4]